MVERIGSNDANARRIAFVEQCFGSSGQPLSVFGRILVGEGVMTKMCRKKPKPRQFFLFNDLLVYGNIVISKKMYNQQRVLNLETVRIVSVPDNDDDSDLCNGFQIISPSKSFIVYAATAAEKIEWMRHLQKCIDMTKDERSTTANNVENSPIWVPDSSVSVCMHCKQSEFSIINRRHHCRKCGVVCCSACSDKQWVLPHLSLKPVRVCQTCFMRLKTNALTSVATATMKMPPEDDESSSEDGELDEGGKQTAFYSEAL